MSHLITCESQQAGMVTVTLNRPDKHNAFNAELIEQLCQTLNTIAQDRSIAVVVLAAAGKCFCAGADLNEMQAALRQSEKENIQSAKKISNLMNRLYHMPQATIAKVQGACYGGGVGLVATCDMAIAVNTAQFKLSEVRLGIIPAVISPYVVKAIGERAARRYALTAESISADLAQQIGLIHTALDANQLEQHLHHLIHELLLNSPRALTACKQLLHQVSGVSLNETLKNETIKQIAKIRISDEAQEGLSAFFEKRPPTWQNR